MTHIISSHFILHSYTRCLQPPFDIKIGSLWITENNPLEVDVLTAPLFRVSNTDCYEEPQVKRNLSSPGQTLGSELLFVTVVREQTVFVTRSARNYPLMRFENAEFRCLRADSDFQQHSRFLWRRGLLCRYWFAVADVYDDCQQYFNGIQHA